MKIEPKELAAQLRKPEGALGIQVAEQLNKTNHYITAFTYDRIPLKKGDTILEIGFGNGKLMPYLLEKEDSIRMAGIDFSEEMVAKALEANEHFVEQDRMELKMASATQIPYPDDHFDHVCSINTLYFWENPLSDAQEIQRVLKPGGSLYLGIRLKEEVESMDFVKYGFRLYSPGEACALLEQTGFSDVRYELQEDPEFEFQGKMRRIHSLVVAGTK